MKTFIPSKRIGFAAAGLIVLVASIIPTPEQVFGSYPFSVRMGQHLLLQLVVPALILLGLPAAIITVYPRIQQILRNPIFTWLCGLAAMWGWHSPALCNAALGNPLLHLFQTLSLPLLGAIFWWPILSPDFFQRMQPLLGIIYLFTACLGCTILGIIITFAPAGIYAGAALPGAINEWQFASPADQTLGGLLMWVPGCLIYFCGVMGLLGRWYTMPEGQTFLDNATESSSS